MNKKRLHGLITLCAILSLSLSACTGPSFRPTRQDGPPKHMPHDLLKIPNAIPKLEPLSRLGNRFGKGPHKTNSYVALKKRYYVLASSHGYKARGLASWYGTRFHGRKTSNGEHYNMFAMTAAHPTLPLPTYVKVTNLTNRKSVIVKINDRGPFHAGRIIDLSYVAAAKLGILGHGTSPVEVVSVDPKDQLHAPRFQRRHPFFHQKGTTRPSVALKKRPAKPSKAAGPTVHTPTRSTPPAIRQRSAQKKSSHKAHEAGK